MNSGKLENYKSGKVENKKSIKLENCTYKYLYILIHIPIQSSIYHLYIPRQYWSFAHFNGGGGGGGSYKVVTRMEPYNKNRFSNDC